VFNYGISVLRRFWLILLAVGPGIFCIGYTIGTGSVTTMAKSGSQYGMRLLWVLALSCLFSWVMMEAAGRYAIVTGQTTIHSLKSHVMCGKLVAIIVTMGIILGQWCCLSGIVGLSSHAIYETLRLFMPHIHPENYWAVLGIAIAIICVMYLFILIGKYSFFEKVLIVFVTIMGLCFIISMFIVLPPPREIAAGLWPRIPQVPGAKLMIAAFVGTTMAAPTFVVRPLLLKSKGWQVGHKKEQSRDAFLSAFLMFIISSSIMICATGALFKEGKSINTVLDMVYTLKPIAGRFCVAIFLIGTLSAGLSSVFPIAMVAPLLVSDYREGKMETRSALFRTLAALACLLGLMVPALGVNPIIAQIATQVSQVFVLPVVILGFIYLLNKKKFMGTYRAGVLLNTGMIAAFAFSCMISYNAILALRDFFTH